MRPVRILEEASQEAIKTAFYELEQSELGAEFFQAIDAALVAIEANTIPLVPLPQEAGETGAKRLIMKRFPYDIVVVELPEEAIVIAVAHHSRKPGYWRERGKP